MEREPKMLTKHESDKIDKARVNENENKQELERDWYWEWEWDIGKEYENFDFLLLHLTSQSKLPIYYDIPIWPGRKLQIDYAPCHKCHCMKQEFICDILIHTVCIRVVRCSAAVLVY